MLQYLKLLDHILKNGEEKQDRTGTGTISVFGYQFRCDLIKGFPLLTTKKIYTKAIIYELLWFISGNTNIGYLKEKGVKIWDKWADKEGNLGPVYGKQWRQWSGKSKQIDQLQQVIKQIQTLPESRRHIITAWNPDEIADMALAPCHCLFQFYVINNRLSCQLYQRSADVFLGVPFNIASYALLTYMIAQITNLQPGDFIHTFGDVHLYSNHKEQALLQLSRSPKKLPTLELNPHIKNIEDYRYQDIKIKDYSPHARIPAPVSV